MNSTSADRSAPKRWEPAQYLKFADERLRPARDLLARVPLESPELIYDLGCGAGNVTALLAAHWPRAKIVGLDSSPEMLDRARGKLPGLHWAQGDIADWRADEPADLIFSNAALHWLDDHRQLLSRLFGELAPAGVLAIQMPRNFDAPSHRLIAETASEGPWRDRLAPLVLRMRESPPVAAAEAYNHILAPLSGMLDIWETIYLHRLTGDTPVLEWIKGTALKPVLEVLDGDERKGFLAELAARLAAAYPPGPDGYTPFPFRRLFIVMRRP